MKNEVRLAIVGCGGWGKNLVRNVANLNALDAVADYSADTAQKFALEYNARAMSFDDILTDRSIDGVMIAAPSKFHFDYAKAVLNAGKHVYVEKPLALSASDAEILTELSRYTGRVLMVGHLLNYHGAFLKILEMIADGKIGAVRSVETRRLGRGPIRENDNALWDLASHDLSMILRIAAQEPAHVSALGNYIAAPLQQNAEVPFISDVHISLRFDNMIAHSHASWLSPVKEHKMIVTGDKGAIVFDDTQGWEQKLSYQPYALTPQPQQWQIDWQNAGYVALTADEPLRNECQHFIDCIQNNQTAQTDGTEALRVARVIDAAQNYITGTKS